MAFQCDRCGKGSLRGKKVTRARQELTYRSPKISRPNLHSFKGILKGKKGKWRLCTKCLRIVKKEQKPVSKKKVLNK